MMAEVEVGISDAAISGFGFNSLGEICLTEDSAESDDPLGMLYLVPGAIEGERKPAVGGAVAELAPEGAEATPHPSQEDEDKLAAVGQLQTFAVLCQESTDFLTSLHFKKGDEPQLQL